MGSNPEDHPGKVLAEFPNTSKLSLSLTYEIFTLCKQKPELLPLAGGSLRGSSGPKWAKVIIQRLEGIRHEMSAFAWLMTPES